MKHLEVKHLRMICAIAETGNMTKAAQRLFISQSGLSQQLKDIETKIGTNFFLRTRKKMLLTESGKTLLKTADQILETLEDTELEIAKMVTGDKGELKVGTQCIFCYQWLPIVMTFFVKKFPNIDFELGNCTDLIADLESKKFDLIISGAPIKDDRFASSPLFEDQIVCIMAKDHPLSAQEFLSLEDFGRFNLITHDEKEYSKLYQYVLKPKGIEPKRFMVISQSQAIIEMIASGFGLATYPQWAVQPLLSSQNITYRPITRKGFPLTWHVHYLRRNHRPIYHEEFIHIVKKCYVPSLAESVTQKIACG